MPIKDTHRYEKNVGGWMSHSWAEDDGNVRSTFQMNDETDSVSLITTAQVLGMYAPTVRVETAVRISYSDLRKLVARAEEILKEREPDGHN